MELLRDEEFNAIFRGFQRTAFHLELQDTYETPEESGPIDRWRRGEPDDYTWHRPWLDLVREATQAGRHISRVRVVSEPHVEYTRWGLVVAELNIDAGEDLRWLPRQLTHGMDLATDDFWLIDDDRVVYTIFEPNGRWAGGALTTDPVVVHHCRRTRDQVWAKAIPHAQYKTR